MSLFINTNTSRLQLREETYPCILGKSGAIAHSQGREGDGKTPIGSYKLRFGLYRADRLPAPPSPLIFHPLDANDGWCDDPDHPAYNRFIRLPFMVDHGAVSHETLWRDDPAYDIILIMSHNDSPPIAGLGSAVFLHIAQIDHRPTLGCVALSPETMTMILPSLTPHMDVIIR